MIVELGAYIPQELTLKRIEARIIDACHNDPLILEGMNLNGVMINRTTDCSGWIIGVQRHYIAVPIEAQTRLGGRRAGQLFQRILDDPHTVNDLPPKQEL